MINEPSLVVIKSIQKIASSPNWVRSVRAIAEELNKRGVGTLRGGVWHGSTVVKLRQRAKGQ